jgi:hypothetical protein
MIAIISITALDMILFFLIRIILCYAIVPSTRANDRGLVVDDDVQLGSGAYPCHTTVIGCYGEGFDTETPLGRAGSLSFCRFSGFLVVFLGLPAGFPTLPALF